MLGTYRPLWGMGASCSSSLTVNPLAQHCMTQNGMAWHSMAQHNMAQHGLAQHSVAQHCTAQRDTTFKIGQQNSQKNMMCCFNK